MQRLKVNIFKRKIALSFNSPRKKIQIKTIELKIKNKLQIFGQKSLQHFLHHLLPAPLPDIETVC